VLDAIKMSTRVLSRRARTVTGSCLRQGDRVAEVATLVELSEPPADARPPPHERAGGRPLRFLARGARGVRLRDPADARGAERGRTADEQLGAMARGFANRVSSGSGRALADGSTSRPSPAPPS